MGLFIFILIIAFIFIGGGRLIGKGVGNALFPNEKGRYVDKSVNHHYHTTIVNNEHKHISIIDEETKEKIFEFQEITENKKE